MKSQNRPPAIFLLGNYQPDRLASMKRFAGLLANVLQSSRIPVVLFEMEAFFNPPALGGRGLVKKWFGYIDKYVLGPWLVKRALRRFAAKHPEHEVIVHICDHSNAVYRSAVQPCKTIITCHDLIAIRAARGEFQGIGTGRLGRILQNWIWNNICKADHLVSVSQATESDLLKRAEHLRGRTTVVLNSLDDPFIQFTPEAIRGIVQNIPGMSPGSILLSQNRGKTILHVGNNAWYKNRDAVLRIFCKVQKQFVDKEPVQLIVVGEPFSTCQETYIRDQGLSSNVHHFAGITDQQLFALYNLADVFLFPSRIEGFGWPPLEAQSCGCPVVASLCGSLPEVLTDSALLFEVEDEAAMSAAVEEILVDSEYRQGWIDRGYQNCERFAPKNMAAGYLAVYETVVGTGLET